MNKLTIDATDKRSTTISLQLDKRIDKITKIAKPRTQITLLLIDEILKKNNLTVNEIDEIKVNTGPGSFTGTRIGVAVANALGFGLSIKINGKPLVEPRYN